MSNNKQLEPRKNTPVTVTADRMREGFTADVMEFAGRYSLSYAGAMALLADRGLKSENGRVEK